MRRRVLFSLVVLLLMVSGCSWGGNQAVDQTNQADLPTMDYAMLPAFKVANTELDLQKSKEYSAKAQAKAVAWKADAELARVELDYKNISNTSPITGKYFYISGQDSQNILEIVVTGASENDIKVGTLNKNQQNFPADYFQVLPLEMWKTTAAKALEVVDNQGGGVGWRSAAAQTAKTYNGGLDSLHAILSLSKINDKLVWSVTYLVPVNEKKGWGEWENQTFYGSVLADSGEMVGGQ